MTKQKKFPTPLIVIGLAILSLLLGASILGENARSEQVSKDYLNAIANMKYNQTGRYLSIESADKNQGFEHLFALEAALQHHFNLPMNQAYLIEAKQESYWLPYSSNNEVKVAVRLSSIAANHDTEKAEYLSGLIELVRESGRWRIKGFNLPSLLERDYQLTREQLAKQQQIVIEPEQITLRDSQIKLASLSAIEQKLWLFHLNSALEVIAAVQPE